MSFLSWVLKVVLDWAFTKLSAWVGGLVRFFKRKAEIEKQAEESVKPMEQAKTEKEIDSAAKDVLGGL